MGDNLCRELEEALLSLVAILEGLSHHVNDSFNSDLATHCEGVIDNFEAASGFLERSGELCSQACYDWQSAKSSHYAGYCRDFANMTKKLALAYVKNDPDRVNYIASVAADLATEIKQFSMRRDEQEAADLEGRFSGYHEEMEQLFNTMDKYFTGLIKQCTTVMQQRGMV
ncbi:hypothetical protein H2198_005783 [Neophaeococcomyces mojaviensis]|uniref:Uncharacterized protein n=1 Tax=Neophaeococcomyces mojaviensis TaxID=3383035 RepID=A0ACC3A4Y1_9EURO|nr:hypothetical protein H2198_005783 [Knufia sp. JES_112]